MTSWTTETGLAILSNGNQRYWMAERPNGESPLRILVVDDNPKMAGAITRGLREHGFAADECHTGFDAEEMAAIEPYDVIVLDLMLPDRDGVDVCRNLRRRKIDSRVLMLTALSSTDDKVEGLDAGADDYLTKPFDFDELLARIRALTRRATSTEPRTLRYHDVELDLDTRQAKRGDRRIKLSNKEFGLLHYLLHNPDRVLSRAQIVSKVWDMNYEPSSNVVDVYISSLRRKIEDGPGPGLIHTVVGAGYRFGRTDDAR